MLFSGSTTRSRLADLDRKAGEIAYTLRRNGCDADPEVVDTLASWAARNPGRSGAAVAAYLAGSVTASQAVAAADLGSGRFEKYLQHRAAGLAHNEAHARAQREHVHRYTAEVHDDRNPVLGTGPVTTTHTCACGDSFADTRQFRWSGD